MLASLFEALQSNPGNYLRASSGDDFDDRIRAGLDDRGYNRILRTDFGAGEWERIKALVSSDKLPMLNPTNRRRHYVSQPYGSQQYPDFLVFDDARIVAIEVKFSASSQGKPVWNGGLPRIGGLYVFGAYGRKDITFFLGRDVVTAQEAKALQEFFDDLKTQEATFNRSMKKQRYGFTAYSRKAFNQRQTHNPDAVLNFFTNPARKELERSALAFLQGNA